MLSMTRAGRVRLKNLGYACLIALAIYACIFLLTRNAVHSSVNEVLRRTNLQRERIHNLRRSIESSRGEMSEQLRALERRIDSIERNAQ